MERKIYVVTTVKKIINSDKAITHDHADLLVPVIIYLYKDNYIPLLDFSEITICTGCFMGRLIGRLVENISQEELKLLEIKDATSLIQTIFNNAKNFGIDLYDNKVAEALKQVMTEFLSVKSN